MLSNTIQAIKNGRTLLTVKEILKRTHNDINKEEDFKELTEFLMLGLHFGDVIPYLEFIQSNFRIHEKEYLRALLFLTPHHPEIALDHIENVDLEDEQNLEVLASFFTHASFGIKIYEINQNHWNLYFYLAQFEPRVDKINFSMKSFTEAKQRKMIKLFKALGIKKQNQVKDPNFINFCINNPSEPLAQQINQDILISNIEYSPIMSNKISLGDFPKNKLLKYYPMLEYLGDYSSTPITSFCRLKSFVNLKETRLSAFAKSFGLNPIKLLSFVNQSPEEAIYNLLAISDVINLTKRKPNLDLSRKISDLIKSKQHRVTLESLSRNCESFFKVYSEDKIFKFIERSLENCNERRNLNHTLSDTAIMLETYLNNTSGIKINLQNVNDAFTLHDTLSAFRNKLNRSNFDLKLMDVKKVAAVDGLILPLSSKKIVIPKDSYELIDWGETLNNCVGTAGYASKCVRKECLILGLFCQSTEKIQYCIEIAYGQLVQFEGKHRIGNNSVRSELIEFLKKRKIIYKAEDMVEDEEYF